MKSDDTWLMAYVDGELPLHEREEVERELRTSPDVAERVALLQASRLPYRDAFAGQKLPPVPASLTAKIDEMARAAKLKAESQTSQPDVSVNDPVVERAPGSPASPTIRSRLRVAPAWLAVAFLGGAFACGLVLRLGPGAGPASNVGASIASVGTGVSPWITAAASYQQLYSRDTVANVNSDTDLSIKTVNEIRQDDGLALRIPDLSAAGLTFKRVQRLRFNNKPLVQIVYLPKEGAPIALCVMKEVKPDAAVADQKVASMTVVTWRQAELGYALIGQPQGVDLTALGKQISSSQVAPLFSRNESRAADAAFLASAKVPFNTRSVF
ncbi:anti-sigma factor [Caballeronia sp. dw_276]|jgi:anti-sigma factor RsiW|uniref:anti-sigma factor family protein n=1 Tax=Caballeronia sp. dw_276 TaxID=2719795 RepID=UPI001BD58415|nr:anti-sigma factor [Caballeronia sp. dw_276]